MAQGPFFGGQRETVTFIQKTDLSAQIGRIVALYGSSTVDVAISGTGGVPWGGILEAVDGTAGASARVCISGITKAIAGQAITAGADFIGGVNNTAPGYVEPASSALAYGKTGTTYITGFTLDSASAASQLISVFVKPFTYKIN